MSDVEEAELEELQHYRRRGLVNEDSDQRNKIRNARVKGLAYVNYENVLVAEKAKPITCKCNS